MPDTPLLNMEQFQYKSMTDQMTATVLVGSTKGIAATLASLAYQIVASQPIEMEPRVLFPQHPDEIPDVEKHLREARSRYIAYFVVLSEDLYKNHWNLNIPANFIA